MVGVSLEGFLVAEETYLLGWHKHNCRLEV